MLSSIRSTRASPSFRSGYRNRFGHPVAEVLARYTALGATVYRTDRDGALLMRFEGEVSVQAWRARHRRYWQER